MWLIIILITSSPLPKKERTQPLSGMFYSKFACQATSFSFVPPQCCTWSNHLWSCGPPTFHRSVSGGVEGGGGWKLTRDKDPPSMTHQLTLTCTENVILRLYCCFKCVCVCVFGFPHTPMACCWCCPFPCMCVCACVSMLAISPKSECVCVDRGHFLVCMCVCVSLLSEECRAGSAPPGEDDVMVDCFLFSEPVEQTISRLHGGYKIRFWFFIYLFLAASGPDTSR